jgi:hypothetical protein
MTSLMLRYLNNTKVSAQQVWIFLLAKLFNRLARKLPAPLQQCPKFCTEEFFGLERCDLGFPQLYARTDIRTRSLHTIGDP